MIGRKIGPYDVLAKLGEGGMGQVYRARDSRLGRDVAIKILPDAFARDAERVARFEREARTLATLNHPNIAGIYGLENGALVMEFVDGEDLSERIARGSIDMTEALAIAKQIAGALETAHESGIVHRDLKPANIKVREDGAVKVLDFGLAKALQQDPSSSAVLSNSPTLTSHGTELGVILGTAAYMAPEQAKGKAVDRRADVWAFGVVLYEMLTGRRLFEASDVSEVLAAVLTREPDWPALPANTPPSVRRLLARCLVKDRASRLDSMTAARLDLDEASIAPVAAALPRTSSAMNKFVAAGLVLAGLVAGALVTRVAWSGARPDEPGVAGTIVSNITATPEAVSAFTYGFALSPDEMTLVYSARQSDGKRMLWKRRLDTPRAELMAGTDDASYPFWSPDSGHVAFFSEGLLKRVPIGGGPTQIVAKISGAWPRGTWSRQDEILFSTTGFEAKGIWRVPATGGNPVSLIKGGAFDPQWLPDGRHFLFVRVDDLKASRLLVAGAQWMAADVNAVDRATPFMDFPESVDQEPEARYSTGGFVIFTRSGVLNMQAFNASTLKTEGPVVPIGDRVGTPRGWFAASTAGHTIVALNPSTAQTGGTPGDPISRLLWVDRSGHVVGQLGDTARYWTLRLSPDGERALVNKDEFLWSLDARTNLKTKVGVASGGLWMPNSHDVIYFDNGALWLKSATGEGVPRRFAQTSLRALAVSPDGEQLALRSRLENGRESFLLMRVKDGAERTIVSGDFSARNASFSHDGRWLAYAADQTGRLEVYARPLDGSGRAVQLSANGGEHPFWGANDKEVFFLSPTDEIIAVDTSSLKTAGAAGTRKVLFQMVTNDITRDYLSPYDVTPDGQKFLINVSAAPEPLTLIQLSKIRR